MTGCITGSQGNNHARAFSCCVWYPIPKRIIGTATELVANCWRDTETSSISEQGHDGKQHTDLDQHHVLYACVTLV